MASGKKTCPPSISTRITSACKNIIITHFVRIHEKHCQMKFTFTWALKILRLETSLFAIKLPKYILKGGEYFPKSWVWKYFDPILNLANFGDNFQFYLCYFLPWENQQFTSQFHSLFLEQGSHCLSESQILPFTSLYFEIRAGMLS